MSEHEHLFLLYADFHLSFCEMFVICEQISIYMVLKKKKNKTVAYSSKVHKLSRLLL